MIVPSCLWSWKPTSSKSNILSQGLLANIIPHPQSTFTFRFEKDFEGFFPPYDVAHNNLTMQQLTLRVGKW